MGEEPLIAKKTLFSKSVVVTYVLNENTHQIQYNETVNQLIPYVELGHDNYIGVICKQQLALSSVRDHLLSWRHVYQECRCCSVVQCEICSYTVNDHDE